MESHPVLQVIRILNPLEQKAFSKTLTKGTRSWKLYHLLKGEGKAPDKKLVFHKMFTQVYTREKDYLLRNELSILRLRLEALILETISGDEAFSQKRAQYYQLAAWFYHRNLYDLSAEYLDKAFKLASRYEDWGILLKINSLQSMLDQVMTIELSGRIEAVKERINDHHRYIHHLYTRETRYMQYLHGLLIKLEKLAGKNVSIMPEKEYADFSLETFKTPMSDFLREKAIAYATGGIHSVHFLEKALEHLEKVPKDVEANNQWFICSGQIASEYSAAGDVKMAEQWFNRIINTPGLEDYPGANFLVLNYIVTLIKAGKYENALVWIDKLGQSAKELFVRERLTVAKISCYIFLRDTVRLKPLLPKDFSQIDIDVRHYYRMQYSIYFYLSGNLEAAEREMQNLLYNKLASQRAYEPLIGLFLLFYQAVASSADGKPGSKWNIKLEKAFRKFQEEATPDVQSMVPALWLVNEWKQIKER